MLLKLLALDDPEIRAAVVFALGALIQVGPGILIFHWPLLNTYDRPRTCF